MTKSFVEINPSSNAPAVDTSPEPKAEDPSRIEVVSVTEEDLPTVETPNTLNVSPLGSFTADPPSENTSAKPVEPQSPAAPSPTMPITKVQPFLPVLLIVP
ncbi:putative protein similar to vertebrate transmembrane protease serine 3 (TMPRSS3) [Scophthalmus maximus]|uniref:Uncharacterized protein n=1 Tax=Scophthalmus maximus TaxID=52904 RepID=A0A2U9C7V7_SCOMX|nr:putative protein similar to vertebrate transmembrane protease serine 3 (TMPRSS3) [Scophthalmus maximus]